MAQLMSMRGLKNFITDLRNAPNKEIERARVDKELANIRMKFKSDKPLASYDKQKYVWKLLYIYMLGYEIEFGHIQILDLVRSQKYSEKQVGYLAATLLLSETSEFSRLFINSILQDIKSRNEGFQCLALTAAANLGGREFAENLTTEVINCLVSFASRPIVRKKAALCLLRLFRKAPEFMNHEDFSSQIFQLIDQERDLGVLLCYMNLLGGLVALQPEPYTRCSALVVQILSRLDAGTGVPQSYTYYGLASPFLQSRCLRVLQYLPAPEDPAVLRATCDVIGAVLRKTDNLAAKNPNKNNAVHAVLIEGIALALYLDPTKQYGDMTTTALRVLGQLVQSREANIRYLALESFARLSVVPGVTDALRGLQDVVVSATQEEDASIKRRAIDLLFILCDESNVTTIVRVLLDHILSADAALKEELALKIAILAERYAPSMDWYVNSALSMMERGGNEVSDDVWHRLVQIVSNQPSLQPVAARRVYQALASGVSHEVLIKAAGYLLGEFARTCPDLTAAEAFRSLHLHFQEVSLSTKGLLLSSYMKLLAGAPPQQRTPQLVEEIRSVFVRYERSTESELQQRSVQYLQLLQRPDLHTQVFQILPALPERKLTESALMQKLRKREGESIDEEVAAAQRVQASYLDGVETALSESPAFLPRTGGGAAAAAVPAQRAPAPAPAPAPPVAVAAPLLTDLLADLDLGVPAPAPVPAPSTSYAAAPPIANPFDDPLPSPVHARAAAAPLGLIQPEGHVEDWYNKLCVANQGVLYQDAFLQLGLKAAWRGAQGRLELFFGNRSATVSLENVACTASCVQEGVWRHAFMQPIPNPIAPGAQMPVTLAIALVKPSATFIDLDLSYTAAGQRCQQRLRVPAPFNKFFTPVAGVNSEQFFAKWRALQQVQEMAHAAAPLSPEITNQRLSTMGFGVLAGIDPNPRNTVAAATATIEGPPGKLICLLRLEVNPNDPRQYRITVASEDPIVATSMKDLLKKLQA